MDLAISPKLVVRAMCIIATLLILHHLAITFFGIYSNSDGKFLRHYARFFTVNREGIVPTMYSTLALLLCAVLLTAIGCARRKFNDTYAVHWIVLGLIFLFLATDEALEIHERLSRPVRNMLDTGGVLYFAWVIPYGIFAMVVGFAYFRFLAALPARSRILFILAGLIYLSGAVGMELFGGRLAETQGEGNIVYALFSTFEEVLEMGGIILFVYALFDYIRTELADLRIGVARG